MAVGCMRCVGSFADGSSLARKRDWTGRKLARTDRVLSSLRLFCFPSRLSVFVFVSFSSSRLSVSPVFSSPSACLPRAPAPLRGAHIRPPAVLWGCRSSSGIGSVVGDAGSSMVTAAWWRSMAEKRWGFGRSGSQWASRPGSERPAASSAFLLSLGPPRGASAWLRRPTSTVSSPILAVCLQVCPI